MHTVVKMVQIPMQISILQKLVGCSECSAHGTYTLQTHAVVVPAASAACSSALEQQQRVRQCTGHGKLATNVNPGTAPGVCLPTVTKHDPAVLPYVASVTLRKADTRLILYCTAAS